MSASLTLRPMTEPEFAAFTEASKGEYAQDHITAGDWAADDAAQRASDEFAQLLPDGLNTADQFFFTAGAGSLGLNVFGANRIARALYESAGFEVTSRQMRKNLH